jgi:DNA polymerase III subunit beta
MKLSCLQENLNTGLKKVLPAVPGRPTLPVLTNILLSTDNGRLKMVATNLDMAITAWVGAKVEEEGQITVPAKFFASIVSSMPDGLINLELDKTKLKVSSGKSRANLPTTKAEDFPPIPKPEGKECEFEPDVLKDAIRRTIFGVLTDDSRPVLTGINLKADGKILSFAAADGFRLPVCKIPFKGEFNVTIPAPSMSRLFTLMEKQEDPVRAVIGESHGLFQLKDSEVVTPFISGTFPDYEKLIPENPATTATVSRYGLLAATRAAAIVAAESSNILCLQFKDVLTLTAQNPESDYRTEIPCALEGEANKAGMDYKYIIDVLGAWDENEVAIELSSSMSPVKFRPVGNDNCLCVVMPMSVNWEEDSKEETQDGAEPLGSVAPQD